MNVFARKNILLSFSVLAAFLLSGCSMNPDVEITNKNVKDAVSSLSKADAAKVAALGGDKYLLGKTLNKVSKQLPADYYNYEINELVEHARLNREFNLAQANKGELTPETVRSDFAESPDEKAIEISEISMQDHYLRALRTELKRPVPLGTATLGKGVLTCRKKDNLIALDELEHQNVEAFKKEKARKLRRKECHEMKRPAKLTLRAEDKGFGGKTIFRTARGWVDAKDLTDRTPAEELARMREDAQEKLTYLKSHPAPQFYHVFRPLLDISAKNPTRIKLAQKAILINMSQHKESWNQAVARFVQEQQDFARSEYACTFDKDCSENQKGNLRMAYYIHTPAPKNVKAGSLPCEISRVSGCRNFTN
jgi:hypothetical protein